MVHDWSLLSVLTRRPSTHLVGKFSAFAVLALYSRS
jgi:hypothetical protein